MPTLPAPFDYLTTCSTSSLESFELSRFNRIANLRKELREILDEWINAEVEARLARWLLNQRRPDAPSSSQGELSFPQPNDMLPFFASDDFAPIGDASRPPLPPLKRHRLVQSVTLRARHDLRGR